MARRPSDSLSLRLPEDIHQRADRLADVLATKPEVAGLIGKPSRAAVIRMAVMKGIEAMEAEYGLKPS